MLSATTWTASRSASGAPSADQRFRGALRPLAAALCALVLTAPAVGCAQGTAKPDTARVARGGTLTMLSATDVDFLDPGRTYYTAGYQIALATQRPLYSFAPGDARRPRPDLAAAPPQIADGGRTLTVRLRSGVRFSPPVRRRGRGRRVRGRCGAATARRPAAGGREGDGAEGSEHETCVRHDWLILPASRRGARRLVVMRTRAPSRVGPRDGTGSPVGGASAASPVAGGRAQRRSPV